MGRVGRGEAGGAPRFGSVIWKTSAKLTKLEGNLWSLKFVWFPPTQPLQPGLKYHFCSVWLCCMGQQLGVVMWTQTTVRGLGLTNLFTFKSTVKWALHDCPHFARWCFAIYYCLFKINVLQFRCVHNGDDAQLYSGLSVNRLSKTKAKFSAIKATKRLIFHIKGRAEKKAILFMGKPVSGTFFMSYKDGNLTLWL